jgi:carbamoyltransferase
MGHAVGAFATSGFEDAAVLIIDGLGGPFEELSAEEQGAVVDKSPAKTGEHTSIYRASGIELRALEKHMVPNRAHYTEQPDGSMPTYGSLGGIFKAVAMQIFDDGSEAGKVMGLAPYGTPTIPTSEFFDFTEAGFTWHSRVQERFKHSRRWPDCKKEYEDLAASAQAALEDALLVLTRNARAKSGLRRLCYAGGVALNSVANERMVREGGEGEIFFMPAAEDSGPAIGAAYHGLWQLTGRNTRKVLKHDSVGRPYTVAEIDAAVARTPAVRCEIVSDPVNETVDLLCKGKIIGWFQGGSELGPRSLGQRSLLCDPRGAETKDIVNARVKHREGFRPFAPIIPLENVSEWFDLEGAPPESPFMLRICKFRPEKAAIVPAVVHVDGTGRLQTLTADANGLLYALVQAFHKRTGVPMLLNTSFNVAGEPIVESPADALWCLIFTGVDHCVLGDRLVSKREGYQSILELYPYVKADLVGAQFPPDSGAVHLDYRQYPRFKLPFHMPLTLSRGYEAAIFRDVKLPPHVRYQTECEWGPVSTFDDLHNLAVVERCNGTSTGHAIMEQLRAAGNPDAKDEKTFVKLLGRLRRAAVLGFREKPMTAA